MKEKRLISCIQGETMRDIIDSARELEVQKEDIVQLFELKGYIYLIYYK